jgi:ATP-binding cassette subfamily C protein CydC
MNRPLLALLLPLWPSLCLSIICALATVAANIGLMTTSAYLISLAALQPPLAALSTAIVGVRFFGLSRAFFRYVERYCGHDAALRYLSALRIWFFRSLEPIAAADLNKYAAADLFSRMVADVEALKFLPIRLIVPLIVAVAVLLGLSVLLASLDGGLALIVFAGVFLQGGLVPYTFYRPLRNGRQTLAATRASFQAAIVDSIRGLRDSAVFDQTGLIRQRFVAANTQLLSASYALQRKAAICDATGILITQLALIGALAILVSLVQQGSLEGIYLAVWALLVQSSFEAFLPLSVLLRYSEEIQDAASRLASLLPSQPTPTLSPGGKLSPPFHLIATNLTYTYPNSRAPILRNINIQLLPGKHIAIVGPSGAGKSTLVSLLSGLQRLDSGSLRLNGSALPDIATAERQAAMGVVQQHDHLFHATVADNLRLARPTASDRQLWQSLDQVFLAELIHSLPNQLATNLGSEGHGLSGGERRRLSLARLLLKNPPIMLLDEPTAGLDPLLTARLLAKGGPLLQPDHAVLLVTHQLTGLQAMDEIIVLDRGQIVEQGPPSTLLANQGYFYELWLLQQDMFNFAATTSLANGFQSETLK